MSDLPQRIGDLERDRAVEALREHHAAGRLTITEFDERMQSALGARTAADLAPLFDDLPRDPGAVLEFLPTSTPHGVVTPYTAASSPSTWRKKDEAEYERLLRLERTFVWVHALGWPLIIGINFLVGWQAWFLFVIMGVVVGSIHGSISDRRGKLAKRRQRAGLPPHPDDEDAQEAADKAGKKASKRALEGRRDDKESA